MGRCGNSVRIKPNKDQTAGEGARRSMVRDMGCSLPAVLILEMQNQASGETSVVLRAAEESGLQEVTLEAPSHDVP